MAKPTKKQLWLREDQVILLGIVIDFAKDRFDHAANGETRNPKSVETMNKICAAQLDEITKLLGGSA